MRTSLSRRGARLGCQSNSAPSAHLQTSVLLPVASPWEAGTGSIGNATGLPNSGPSNGAIGHNRSFAEGAQILEALRVPSSSAVVSTPTLQPAGR
jgi:hypothetical protein